MIGLGERCQPRRRGRRAGVANHGRGVSRPHLGILGLGGGDRRRVLPEDVGRDERRQQGAVGRDHRWRHCLGERRLVGEGRGPGLIGGFLSLGAGGPHPLQVRGDRCDHGRRRRPNPWTGSQSRDLGLIRVRRRLQRGGQFIPGRRGGQHWSRPWTGVHPRGVNLRRQCEVHVVLLRSRSGPRGHRRPRCASYGDSQPSSKQIAFPPLPPVPRTKMAE